jgi:PIN domain nuclease of toxin-antitoxin system
VSTEVSNEQPAALKAKTAAQGLTVQDLLKKLAHKAAESTGVADTHAGLWYLFGDPRLSMAAKASFETAAKSRRKILLSVISLAEVIYYVREKPRSRVGLHDPDHVPEEAPVTAEIIEALIDVPRSDIPDMPDRIVAATAVYFGVPTISRDGRIRVSKVQTVW